MNKFAIPEGTRNFARRFLGIADGHFRSAQGLNISSIGIGTYLGGADAQTDENYTNAIARFVQLGGNVIDTAANYRFQRSERNIGNALAVLREKGFERDEIFICTKGGYLPFDNAMPRSREEFQRYFEENFVKKGIATFEDLVGGSHCMTPLYLQSQIDQSLQNMQIETVDVFYIHNPESQLDGIDKNEFEARLAKAFELLEKNRADEKISFYGAATWDGFRVSPQDESYHSLERMFNIAEQIGGENHGFRFIQLPFNLGMPEAFAFPNQAVNGKVYSTIEAAAQLGVSVICSASILQGKLARNLPSNMRAVLGNMESDALASLQFARSAPNVTTALIGMSNTHHVEENMKLANVEPMAAEKYKELFARK